MSSVTMEVELAGDTNTWTPLLDARTRHPLVSDNNTVLIITCVYYNIVDRALQSAITVRTNKTPRRTALIQ